MLKLKALLAKILQNIKELIRKTPYSVDSSNNITFPAKITATSAQINGNVNSTGNVSASGAITATGKLTGGSGQINGALSTTGNISSSGTITANGNMSANGQRVRAFKTQSFSIKLTSKGTGSKTNTFTVPSGWSLVSSKSAWLYISGNALCYVTDYNMTQSGTTVTISWYLQNGSGGTPSSLILTGDALLWKS